MTIGPPSVFGGSTTVPHRGVDQRFAAAASRAATRPTTALTAISIRAVKPLTASLEAMSAVSVKQANPRRYTVTSSIPRGHALALSSVVKTCTATKTARERWTGVQRIPARTARTLTMTTASRPRMRSPVKVIPAISKRGMLAALPMTRTAARILAIPESGWRGRSARSSLERGYTDFHTVVAGRASSNPHSDMSSRSRDEEPPTGRPRVSVVVETENERTKCEIGLRHALRALADQTYPHALAEVIVVDSGEVPGLARLVEEHRPGTRIVNGAGLREFQMKNLGAREATGEIVAFTDGDCEPRADWIEQIVKSLEAASPSVIGVQGRTILREGLFSRQISALLYGIRTDGSGHFSRRIISDNCAFRRDFIRQAPFEPATLPSTPETVLWMRTAGKGLAMIVNDEMRSTHDYPKTDGPEGWAAMLGFFLQRAYSNGYCMTRVRFLVSGLRATWTRWLGPAGPPILVAGKMVADLDQIARNNRILGLSWLDWIAFSPLYVGYYLGHLVGGYAALLRLPAPRS